MEPAGSSRKIAHASNLAAPESVDAVALVQEEHAADLGQLGTVLDATVRFSFYV